MRKHDTLNPKELNQTLPIYSTCNSDLMAMVSWKPAVPQPGTWETSLDKHS